MIFPRIHQQARAQFLYKRRRRRDGEFHTIVWAVKSTSQTPLYISLYIRKPIYNIFVPVGYIRIDGDMFSHL